VQRFSLAHEWDHHKLPESAIDFHDSSSYRHCWGLSPCAAQVIFSNRYVVNMDTAECILLGDQLSVFEWQSPTVRVRWSSVAGKVSPKGRAIALGKHVPYSGRGSSPHMFNAAFSCCQNVQTQSNFCHQVGADGVCLTKATRLALSLGNVTAANMAQSQICNFLTWQPC